MKTAPFAEVKNGSVRLNTGLEGYIYDFDIECINTESKLNAFISHLREKRWFTPEHERFVMNTSSAAQKSFNHKQARGFKR